MNAQSRSQFTRPGHFTQSGAERCRSKGLTLIELMIAVTVGAIVIVLALPNFAVVLQKNRIRTAADQLYVSLAEARGEAVKRRAAVTVCPSSDNSTCRNDGVWSDGWIIIPDADRNRVSDTGSPIKVVPSSALADGVDLGSAAAVVNGVVFEATGAVGILGGLGLGSSTAGAFWVCHSNSTVPSREVDVSLNGRIEASERTGQSNCNA